jgi:hypothetical protein
MKFRPIHIVLPVLALGVASAPMLSAETRHGRASVPAVLIPPPREGAGHIVFYRTGDIMGIGSGCTIFGDGYQISKLGQRRFFIVAAEPGRHDFAVYGEGTDTLTIEVEPDEIQYVMCRILVGLTDVRPDLRPSTQAEFVKARTTKMVDDDDMGPGPGALRARDVARARSEAVLASEPSN